MAADQDIIDLTEELSDLGIPSPSISSAKKRPPPRLDFEPAPKRGAIKEKLRLLGRSFAVDRFEKHYRAVQIGDMVIEVGKALVYMTRWLTLGRLDDHFGFGVSSWGGRWADMQSSSRQTDCQGKADRWESGNTVSCTLASQVGLRNEERGFSQTWRL